MIEAALIVLGLVVTPVLSAPDAETVRPALERGERVMTGCHRTVRPVAAGAPLTEADMEPVPCELRAARSSVYFDPASGLVRARMALSAGQPLGRFALAPDDLMDAGQSVVLKVQRGAVRVERSARLLEPAQGEAVFVEDESGAVFAWPVADLSAAEGAQ